MRKYTFSFLCLLALSLVGLEASAQSSVITFNVDSLGITIPNPDGAALPNKEVKSLDGKVTLTLEKGGGRANPAYRQPTGEEPYIDVFAPNNKEGNGNLLTFKAKHKMTKMTIDLAADKPERIVVTCSTGAITYPNAKTVVWEGNTSNVVISVTFDTPADSWERAKMRKFSIDLLEDGSAAVESIVEDNDAPVRYYNLLGVEVENPTEGIYIKIQGKKVEKIAIKRR